MHPQQGQIIPDLFVLTPSRDFSRPPFTSRIDIPTLLSRNTCHAYEAVCCPVLCRVVREMRDRGMDRIKLLYRLHLTTVPSAPFFPRLFLAGIPPFIAFLLFKLPFKTFNSQFVLSC